MCNNADILSIFMIIKSIITIIKIVVPLVLIISLMINYVSAIKSDDSDLISKANKGAVSKIIAALLIFLIPTFVNIISGMAAFDNSQYLKCIRDANPTGVTTARKEEALKRIESVKREFSRAEYVAAKTTINKIKDAETKKELLANLEQYEKYVIIMEGLNSLKTKKTRDKAKEVSELIKALSDDDPYKKQFEELLKEIGVGVPLDVAEGIYDEYYGNLRYFVYMPPEATTNMPVLLWLHGDNHREEWARNAKYGKTAYKAGYPIILIYPFVGPSMGHEVPGWESLLPTVKEIVDEVCNKYECNRESISVGGHSRGAIGTWKMVSDYPGYFHAAAPVSCCSFSGLKPESFTGMKVWAVRGSGAGSGYDNDDNYACMGSDVEKVRKYAKEVKYTILPHTTHGAATDELQLSTEFSEFMFGE